MSETPIKGFSKFHTISMYGDRSTSIGFASTSHRLKQRKSNSVLANPESLLATTIPNIQQNLSLPKIHKRKKEKKQGTFLQSWLDQALGAPDPFAVQKQNQPDKIEGNVLKTLKKFELDKRHLQSQNIPGEKVERLYKSLYIYSHGVNKIFEQLLSLTKQTNNLELIGNFWRAYTKLLESCTSYQTVFQKVQRDHLQNIQRLKHNIEIRTQSFEQQKKELQTKITRLQKNIEQRDVQYKNLKTEYDVLHNTLNLTDQAFNDEVNLRLKFEQKINAVYTSYEQLKTKYSKVVQEMGIKKMEFLQRDNKQAELKNKLLVETTKVDELMFLLKAQRQKVQERNEQIAIKVQQLEDAKSMLLAKANQEDNTHDKIQQHLIKLKALKTRLIQVENVVSGQKITIKQQQQQMKKMSKSLQDYKNHNNQIYDKYAVSGKKVVELQSKIQEDDIKIMDLQRAKMEKSSEITDLNRELEHVKNERDNLRHELNIATKNLKDTKDTMTKNNIIMQDMKAVKDKYERINQFLKQQVKQLQDSNNRMSQDLSIKTEQLEGMKLLLENRNKSLVQMQKQIQQQKQLNKAKVAGLNATIAKKQNLVLQYQKKKEEQDKQISDLKILLKISEDKSVILQSQKIKVQVQLSGKVKVLKQLQQVLDKQNFKFKELNSKLEGQLKEKSDISSKLMTTQFVLKTKNQQQRVQVQSLTTLLSEYKNKIVQRAQYVHPMLYQQALQTARRCARNEQRQKKQANNAKKQQQAALKKCEKLEIEVTNYKTIIQNLESKNAKLNDERIRLMEKMKKTEDSLKNMTASYDKQQRISKKYSDDVEECKKVEAGLQEKMKVQQELITNMKIKIEQLVAENKKKSRSDTRQLRRQKQVKKVKIQQQTQTQMEQQPEQQPQIPKQARSQKQNKQTQTDPEKLTQQKSQDIMVPVYIQNKEEQPAVVQKKQQVPPKKVENKDFRKALKLTYMRR